MKWRHNVNHIIIACKNFFYEIHDNLFVANIFRFDFVVVVRVLYQSPEKLSSRTSLSPVNGKLKWSRKIVGLQYN